MKNIFLKRAISFYIDLGIVSFLNVAYIMTIGAKGEIYKNIGLVFFILLFIFRDALFGRSVGKMLFKLKIVKKNGNEKVTFRELFLRNIASMLWMVDAFLLYNSKPRIMDKILQLDVIEDK